MKVLLINTVYGPGSTGKIIKGLNEYLLSLGVKTVACYGRNSKLKDDEQIKLSSKFEFYFHVILTRLFGYQGIYSFFSTRKLLNIIKKEKPDIVHLFNIHGYYLNEFKLLGYLKQHGIKTIYSMLDEYPYMGKCCYSYECDKFKASCYNCGEVNSYPKSLFFDRSSKIQKLKDESYSQFDNLIFTAPKWVVGRAKESFLLKNKKIVEIDEFIETEKTFYPRETGYLREKLNISNDVKVILTVAPSNNIRKGTKYYLDAAKKIESTKIVFIHVGYTGDCSRLPANFIPVGYVSNQDELAEYYSLADLFVCTSLADTMPNVCLDSLACGTPVCGFDAAGTSSVATAEFGTFVPVLDVDALCKVILNAPQKTLSTISACRDYAVNRYSKETVCSIFYNLYK